MSHEKPGKKIIGEENILWINRHKEGYNLAHDELTRYYEGEIETLRKALSDLITAVTFKGSPEEFGKPDESNMCYDARVPVAFIDNAKTALNERSEQWKLKQKPDLKH